jgi:plasmid stability protein
MAQLIVRNVEDEVVRALKQRAALHGVSAEAEHRAILKSALLGHAASRSFKQALLAMPDVGADSDFDPQRDSDRHVEIGSLKTARKPRRDLRAKRSGG